MARQGQSMVMLLASAFVVLSLMSLTAAEQCGRQAGGQTCPDNLCCSQWGWCGNTPEFCTNGCQSQCTGGGGVPPPSGGGTGQASFYGPEYVPSACFGFDPNQFPANRHFAAGGDGNPNIWSNGGNCGKYFTIRCQGRGCRGGGAITIKIVDRCPNGCSGGRAFDLSKEAFSAIADPDVGVITVSYSQAFNSEGDAVPWAQQEFITEAGVHMGE